MEKTRNLRKKLNFSAFLESCGVKKMSKKEPGLSVVQWLNYILMRLFYSWVQFCRKKVSIIKILLW